MDCPSCGRSNRPGARFCGECGSSLAPRCPACGATRIPDARFCDACGASLQERPVEKAIARKVVTVVFADLIGSVSLHERLDAESARRVIDRYHRAMTAAVDVHGGKVVQLLGDGVLAAFGVPSVAEDDAIRAVRAGVGMQRAFRELVREHGAQMKGVGLRVAVNTGEVVTSDDETAVIGDPTNVAARLQHEARDGDVLLGEATQRLVGDLVTLAPLGSFALKGRSETVTAWRVVSLDRPAGARTTAFVGRDEELRRLAAVLEGAVAAPAARMVVLLGSPGLGKSRLVAEFTQRANRRATVLAARCDAAGGATFAPIAEALRAFLRIEEGAGGDGLRAAIDAVVPGDEAERGRIAAGIGALFSGAPSSPEETFFAVRRLLAALAAARPVVLVIDDLHWAEPLLLDLVEHLVQWSAGVPLFLLVAARPELRDARSSLAAPGPLVADVVTLGGLDAAASMRLAAGVVGAPELPAALVGRVLATSEGNPLFLGELVRMLVQDGTLVREGERWVTTVEVAKLDMPPTIQVLLAARIERLRLEERSVLERAAVIGRVFSRAAVAHLLGPTSDLDARLEALRRSELIEADTGWVLGEPALRFHHVLIRDAAYRRLLKETRAELHEQLADWVIGRAGESVEHDETIGFHLEHAHQNRLELGLLDAHGRALGERAAQRLGAAGRRALARDDVALAAGLLGRALACLDPQDPARADLALDWCEALLAAGEVGSATHAIAELGRFAASSERLRAWHACFTGQLAVLTNPQALRAAAETVATAAESLTAAGDATGEAKAHSVHALVLAQLGKIGACEAALDRALAAARRAGERRLANAVLAGAPLAALWGPSPVTRASGRCLDVVRVLRITQGAPAVEAVALRCQAVLETLRGRGEAARRMIAASRSLVEELGIAQQVLEADLFAGLIELLEDDAAAAQRWLRPAWDGLRAQGLGIDAAEAGALLARALLAQGRIDEADSVSLESESLAGDSFKAAIAWRGVRAEVLAARGEHRDAIDFARAAVEIAAATDDLLDHADARATLAVALRATGRSAEADAEQRRAIELWEAKGATLLVERARREAAPPAPLRPAPQPSLDPVAPARRRVRANTATAALERVTAALAARDAEAVRAFHADTVRAVDHTTGAILELPQVIEWWRLFFGDHDATLRADPVATLGDSLVLNHLSWIGAASNDAVLSVGSFEGGSFDVLEFDAEGRAVRIDTFGPVRLGDAVVRLYERYAELRPDGVERERAAAIARSVAAVVSLTSSSTERYRAILAPGIEFEDYRALVRVPPARGLVEWRQRVESWFAAIEDSAYSIYDVLDLQPAGFVARFAERGRDRTGGGRFEIQVLNSYLFDAESRLARVELFDPDQESDALAHFDELTARPPAPRATRQVRPNAATIRTEAFVAAVAARDLAAVAAVFADDMQTVHHPTGLVYDHAGGLASIRPLLEARDVRFELEPLATLGDSLALCHHRVAASAIGGTRFDVGGYEQEFLVVVETGPDGRNTRAEMFAPDKLGDAIVRLYERHAELLPEGTARERAAAVARSVAAVLGPYDIDRYAAAQSPAIEFVDRRTVGVGELRGRGALRQWFDTQLELGEGIATRIDDVLALGSDALVLRWVILGIERSGGGPYERHFLWLGTFGADGLLTRIEQFEPDREADAVARFDELAASRPAGSVQRRVLANEATAPDVQQRMNAAIAARDVDALRPLHAPGLRCISHATGAVLDLEQTLAWWRLYFADHEAVIQLEPIAGLGDRLALNRGSYRADASHDAAFDAGAFEVSELSVVEVDAEHRAERIEIFPGERLGDAIVRLYERHAERLPEGPERERAAAVARTVAVYAGPMDRDRYAATWKPDLVYVDHRTLGLGSAAGMDEFGRVFATLVEAAPDASQRYDDVLALRPDAWLVRNTNLGTDRSTGGAYERPYLLLVATAADGLVTRIETFDADREAEALARFEALVAQAQPTLRRLRPNAVTDNAARLTAAIRARDEEAIPDLLSDGFEAVDHKTGASYGRDGAIATAHMLIGNRDLVYRQDPIATLGERLALLHTVASSSGTARGGMDVGPFEAETIHVVEVDERGRRHRNEWFARDRLGDAIARLYTRYAEMLPDCPARDRAAATARSVAMCNAPPDADRLTTALAPSFVCVDHRSLGTWSAQEPDEWLTHWRGQHALVASFELRDDDVLALEPHAYLVRQTYYGRDRLDGAFENPILGLFVFGADGLLVRAEAFEPDREAEALARFDALSDAPPAAPFANAAIRWFDRFWAAWEARDWARVAACFATSFRLVDRQKRVLADYDRERQLEMLRWTFQRSSRYTWDLLATRGERLALVREVVHHTGRTIGATELEALVVAEVNEAGDYERAVLFDSDDIDAAYAELDERYAVGEAKGSSPFETTRRYVACIAARDWERLESLFAADFVMEDHRPLGWGVVLSARDFVRPMRAMFEMRPDATFRIDHVPAVTERSILVVGGWSGSEDAGAFEIRNAAVTQLDADGRIRCMELFDLDQLDEARARFAEPTREPRTPPRIENAVTRSFDRIAAASIARDWDRLAAEFAPAFVASDRRRLLRREFDRDRFLAAVRLDTESYGQRLADEVLATRGERLALVRLIGEREGEDGPSESEWLDLLEVDADGRRIANVAFDPGDIDAAYEELRARYDAGEAAPHARVRAIWQRYAIAFSTRDWDALAAVLAPEFRIEDHRKPGLMNGMSREDYVASVRSLVGLRPDVRLWIDHVLALDERRSLQVGRFAGAESEGSFETILVIVIEYGADTMRRWHAFDVGDLDAARTCYEALPAPAPPRIENAATRSEDACRRAWKTHDWDAFLALYRPDFRSIDRRPLMHLEVGLDAIASAMRPIFEMGGDRASEFLATRGERLALVRLRFCGSSDVIGPSEVEILQVIEVDTAGLRSAAVAFGPDDLDAAHEELDRRFLAGEASGVGSIAVLQALADAITARDWGRLVSCFASDFALEDHRSFGTLRQLSGAEWAARVRSLFALRPDATLRTDHVLAFDARRVLAVGSWIGGHAEGAFEIPSVLVGAVGPDGFRRWHDYDLDDLDAARARYDELGVAAPRDPLAALVRPNAATAAMDRVEASLEARDWAALRTLAADGARFEDRRRLVLVSYEDADGWVADLKRIRNVEGFELRRTIVATAGDRVCLERTLFVGGPPGGRVEVEALWLSEVDEGGRLVDCVLFDGGDWRAASREGVARWVARDPIAAAVVGPVFETIEGWNDRDRDRMRAALADDLVVEDRRLAGQGRVEGADAYLGTVAELWELAFDESQEPGVVLALERHGMVGATRYVGTLASGGPYEGFNVDVLIVTEGKVSRIEMFEIEHVDVALARFAELGLDPLRIPPNAATRASDRMREYMQMREWELLRALCEPIVLEDRRRLIRTTGGCEMAVANAKLIAEAGVRVSRTVLATAGDCLALESELFTGPDPAQSFEVETLRLLEVDGDGRIAAVVVFDCDDRRAAFRELLERHARSESGRALPAALHELRRALLEGDLERARAALPPDFAVQDHRKSRLWRIEGRDAWVAWMATLFEQSPDTIIAPLYYLAIEDHGCLGMHYSGGTLPEGGEFEQVFVSLYRFRDGRLVDLDMFEPEDLDRARARFEELRNASA